MCLALFSAVESVLLRRTCWTSFNLYEMCSLTLGAFLDNSNLGKCVIRHHSLLPRLVLGAVHCRLFYHFTVFIRIDIDHYCLKLRGSELAWKIYVHCYSGSPRISKGHIQCHEPQHFLKTKIWLPKAYHVGHSLSCDLFWLFTAVEC